MKLLLWTTGILAAMAVACPQLVVWGYLLLILPGLILTIAPTVFIYLAGTAIIRRLLPMDSSVKSTAVSLGLMLVLGWAVMQPFRSHGLTAYQTNALPDVAARQAVVLSGDVRIECPDQRCDAECDWLCTALLDMPEVESVTLVTAGGRQKSKAQQIAAFRMEAASGNPSSGLSAQNPGQVVREYSPVGWEAHAKTSAAAAKHIDAYWAMRFAGTHRLRTAPAVTTQNADWLIRIDYRKEGRTSKIRRVTVSDSNGRVCFRKSDVERHVAAAMFYLGFHVQMGAGTVSGAYFDIGQQLVRSGNRRLKPAAELLTALDYQPPECDAQTIVQLRRMVQQAVSNPQASDAHLSLPGHYLGLFHFNTQPHDHALIADIVADKRFQQIDESLVNVFSKRSTPVRMRDAYAERIAMSGTSPKLRQWLAECLINLPAGTFSQPTEVQQKIWNSPTDYPGAGAFLTAAADLPSNEAVRILQAALGDATEIADWQSRRPIVEGVREAFVRLGPTASAAVDQVNMLFLQRPSPLMTNAGQADDWRFALLCMGVAVDDLPFFPNQSAASVKKISQKLRQKFQRYNQKQVVAGVGK